MKKIGLILLAGFSLLLAPVSLHAQVGDPSEVFLKAYMTSQQGEKLEQEQQYAAALAKFRFAGSLLEELRKGHADWQPAIVEYRATKIGESILRVQNKAGTQADLAATNPPPPAASPFLPQNAGPAEPSVDVGASERGAMAVCRSRLSPNSQRSPAPQATACSSRPQPVTQQAPAAVAAATPNEAAIKAATKKLQDKVDQLEADLKKSRTEITSVQKEKETLTGRLQETNSKLEKAQGELQKTPGRREAGARSARAGSGFTQEDPVERQCGCQGRGSVARRDRPAEECARSSAEQGRAAAEKEKDDASAKLTDANTQVASMTKERDELVAAAQERRRRTPSSACRCSWPRIPT